MAKQPSVSPVVVIAERPDDAYDQAQLVTVHARKKTVQQVWLVGDRAMLDLDQIPPACAMVPIVSADARRRAHPGSNEFIRRTIQWAEAYGMPCATSSIGISLSLCATECAIHMKKHGVPCARTALLLSDPASLAADIGAAAMAISGVAHAPPRSIPDGNGLEHGTFIQSDMRIDTKRISYASQATKLCEHNDIERSSNHTGLFAIRDEIQDRMDWEKQSNSKLTLIRSFVRLYWVSSYFVGVERVDERTVLTSPCPCDAKDFKVHSSEYIPLPAAADIPGVPKFVAACESFVAFASSIVVCISCVVDPRGDLCAYAASCTIKPGTPAPIREAWAKEVARMGELASAAAGDAAAAAPAAPAAPAASDAAARAVYLIKPYQRASEKRAPPQVAEPDPSHKRQRVAQAQQAPQIVAPKAPHHPSTPDI